MKSDHSEHAIYVDTWVDRLPKNLAPEQLVSAFEQGFNTLWRRAQRTLGEVTMSAIADRIFHDASAQFPALGPVRIEHGIGVQFDELRRRIRPEEAEQVREGMRSTLIEFLTVIGTLTAEILTPVLHVELNNARVEDLNADGSRRSERKSRDNEGMNDL